MWHKKFVKCRDLTCENTEEIELYGRNVLDYGRLKVKKVEKEKEEGNEKKSDWKRIRDVIKDLWIIYSELKEHMTGV